MHTQQCCECSQALLLQAPNHTGGKKHNRSLEYEPDLLCLIRARIFQGAPNVTVLTDLGTSLTVSRQGKLQLGP